MFCNNDPRLSPGVYDFSRIRELLTTDLSSLRSNFSLHISRFSLLISHFSFLISHFSLTLKSHLNNQPAVVVAGLYMSPVCLNGLLGDGESKTGPA